LAADGAVLVLAVAVDARGVASLAAATLAVPDTRLGKLAI